MIRVNCEGFVYNSLNMSRSTLVCALTLARFVQRSTCCGTNRAHPPLPPSSNVGFASVESLFVESAVNVQLPAPPSKTAEALLSPFAAHFVPKVSEESDPSELRKPCVQVVEHVQALLNAQTASSFCVVNPFYFSISRLVLVGFSNKTTMNKQSRNVQQRMLQLHTLTQESAENYAYFSKQSKHQQSLSAKPAGIAGVGDPTEALVLCPCVAIFRKCLQPGWF